MGREEGWSGAAGTGSCSCSDTHMVCAQAPRTAVPMPGHSSGWRLLTPWEQSQAPSTFGPAGQLRGAPPLPCNPGRKSRLHLSQHFSSGSTSALGSPTQGTASFSPASSLGLTRRGDATSSGSVPNLPLGPLQPGAAITSNPCRGGTCSSGRKEPHLAAAGSWDPGSFLAPPPAWPMWLLPRPSAPCTLRGAEGSQPYGTKGREVVWRTEQVRTAQGVAPSWKGDKLVPATVR